MNFSEQLKQAMAERGLTQTELANMTGLAKSGISQYMSGRVNPPPKTKKQLADALNVSFDECMPPLTDKIPEPLIKRITPEQAAKVLGQSKNTIRAALRQGTSPFGYACKGRGGKWIYHISPKKLNEYAGATV